MHEREMRGIINLLLTHYSLLITHYSLLITQHFQVSQSRENPTTKHESMIFSQMVLQNEVVVH